MAFAQSARPIEGAVATLGVSDRVAFLRKTYAHLAVALLVFAGVTGFMMRFMTETSYKFSAFAFKGQWNWAAVLVAFMVVGWVAEKLARSNTSKGLQYLGLAIACVGEAVLLQPMLWVLFIRFGHPADFVINADGTAITSFAASGLAIKILMESVIITMVIFCGLTATVFITKKDFSFMRGALTIASFAALGVIVGSMIFGFQLGAIFSGAMILLMSLYVLYQTSLVMQYFPPTGYVAAALMLFSTIATLFWYVLRLMMELQRR
jgi:FtsH-binding integral membrane protein